MGDTTTPLKMASEDPAPLGHGPNTLILHEKSVMGDKTIVLNVVPTSDGGIQVVIEVGPGMSPNLLTQTIDISDYVYEQIEFSKRNYDFIYFRRFPDGRCDVAYSETGYDIEQITDISQQDYQRVEAFARRAQELLIVKPKDVVSLNEITRVKKV